MAMADDIAARVDNAVVLGGGGDSGDGWSRFTNDGGCIVAVESAAAAVDEPVVDG